MYFYVYASNINYLFAPPSGNYPWPQYLRNPEILYKTEDYNDLFLTIKYVSKNLKIAKKKAILGFKNLNRFDYNRNCEKYYNLIN